MGWSTDDVLKTTLTISLSVSAEASGIQYTEQAWSSGTRHMPTADFGAGAELAGPENCGAKKERSRAGSMENDGADGAVT